jgi:TRAP-type C4-dicarboxylate transport system substrate-binding protein
VRVRIAFHPPARSATFQGSLKPFAEAATREAGGAVDIELCPDGTLGGKLTTQLALVESGDADAAFVIPGFTPERFPDNFVFGIPGLFRDITEASLVFSRVVAVGKLRGYENFFVIGAFCTEPFSLHARQKLTCIADLKGMRLRAANAADEIMLKQLGADARIVPGDQIFSSIEDGTIDGTTLHAGPLYDLGISRVTRFDYFLRLGCAPLTVLVNRQSFARLPVKGQDAIRKFSGDWFAASYASYVAAHNEMLLAKMRADPMRTVTDPPEAEIEDAAAAFHPIVERWLSESPRNQLTLDAVREEIARHRTAG